MPASRLLATVLAMQMQAATIRRVRVRSSDHRPFHFDDPVEGRVDDLMRAWVVVRHQTGAPAPTDRNVQAAT